jgi:chaperonin GroES
MNEHDPGIQPTGGHILVLPEVVEEVTAGGIIIPTDTREKEQQAATVGELVAVGPSAWKDIDDGKPWAEVGDKVSYSRYAGVTMQGMDGKEYILLNDNDVLARLLF